MKNRLAASFALASLFLVACGDSGSGSDADNKVAVQEENKATLENGKVVYCDNDHEGVVAALAEGSFRRCEDGLWVKISASEALKAEEIIGLDKVKSSSSVTQSSSSLKPPTSTESSSSEQVSQPVEESSCSANKDPVEELYECADGSLVENLDDCKASSSSSSSSNVNSSSSSVTPDQESSSSSATVIPDPESLSSATIEEGSCSSVASSSSAPIEDPGSEYDKSKNTLKDLRDNQTYKTVTIGTQTWMAENLNYNYNEGTAKSYCYENDESKCDIYGRLYTWAAAMDSAAVFSIAGKGCGYGVECSPSGTIRGVCPEGWHLPNNDEWNVLRTLVGGKDVAGKKLKSTSGWYKNGNGTDEYGFAALPAGERFFARFYDIVSDARFWTSTEDYSPNAYHLHICYEDEGVYDSREVKDNAFSVRCLRD